MFSIGQMSRRTGVKVPTIRYYEEIGVLENAGRSAGNQRRYDSAALERLQFVRHARELGFSLDDIRALIDLQGQPRELHASAVEIAARQLAAVRDRIARLRRLEAELARIAGACDGTDNCDGAAAGECAVLQAMADHTRCDGAHG